MLRAKAHKSLFNERYSPNWTNGWTENDKFSFYRLYNRHWGSTVGTVNTLRDGRPRNQDLIPHCGVRFLFPLQRPDWIWEWVCVLLAMLWGAPSPELQQLGYMLTTHQQPVLRLRIQGAIPPFLHMPYWNADRQFFYLLLLHYEMLAYLINLHHRQNQVVKASWDQGGWDPCHLQRQRQPCLDKLDLQPSQFDLCH